MNNWKTLTFGVFIGLLSSGLILLVAKGTSYSSFELQPIPTPKPLFVHITGGVVSPGVYQIPVQSRVWDVVEAAGGFIQEADKESMNLSEMVSDGQKIAIPIINTGETKKSSSQISLNEPNNNDVIERININAATAETLLLLPGIGPVTAANIIEYRETHGTFTSAEEIMNVRGIGISSFEEIKDFITLR